MFFHIHTTNTVSSFLHFINKFTVDRNRDIVNAELLET